MYAKRKRNAEYTPSRWTTKRRRVGDRAVGVYRPGRPASTMPRSFTPANKEFTPLGYSRPCTFRYATSGQVNVAAGGVPEYIRFRANGLYDPEVAVGGHQPYGFDQMMGLFNHFTVLGAKLTVRCANNNAIPIFLFSTLRGDSSVATTTDALLERPQTQSVLMNVDGVSELVHKFSAAQFFGKSKTSLIGGADFRGNVAQDPAEQAYFNVGIAPNWTTDDPVVETLHVVIEYYAILTEPKTLHTS